MSELQELWHTDQKDYFCLRTGRFMFLNHTFSLPSGNIYENKVAPEFSQVTLRSENPGFQNKSTQCDLKRGGAHEKDACPREHKQAFPPPPGIFTSDHKNCDLTVQHVV